MKPLTTIFVAAISALCAVSCTQPEYASFYDMFTKERTLTADEQIVISQPLASIGSGVIYGSHLIANNSSDKKDKILVININTGEVESSILPKGNGRNEAGSAHLFGMHRDEVVCYDYAKSSFLKTEFDEVFKPTATQSWRKQENNWEGYFGASMSPGFLDDDRYIYCGCREDGLFEIVDSTFNAIYTFEEYKRLDGDEIERAAPYDGTFYTTPSMERMLYTTRGNVLYFYDISDTTSEPKLLNKYIFDMQKCDVKYYDNGGVAVGPSEDCLIGTTTVAVGNNHYYLLNMNKKYSEIESAADWACNTLYVFDRDGKPIEKITLDRGVRSIFYSAENNSLYTISLNDKDEDCLIRYQL